MGSKSFLERWAIKSVDRRDREFYLVALPLTVTVVGLAPHFIQLLFVPVVGAGVWKLSAQVVAGAVTTGVICYALTRWLSRPGLWGPQRSRWSLAKHLLLLWTPIALLVDLPLRLGELLMIGPQILSQNVLPYALGVSMGRTFLFAGGIVFYERLMGAVLEAADQRQRALMLETQTLKNLVQPHFLLNSLNAVRAHMEDSPKVAEEMLLSLTSLLRKVIQFSGANKISLSEEIGAISEYVNIMNCRYERKVRLEINGASKTQVMMPPLIIFSLVENSFKHGFSERKDGVISINVEASERLRIIVNDNGSPNLNIEQSGGLGGQYVQSRLELAFGDDFAFKHGRKADDHYEAVIEIPWESK